MVTLQASATWVGVLNASRWVPYLLFGLVAGVLVALWLTLSPFHSLRGPVEEAQALESSA
ncbi:MAG TPA: hypothetical protein VEK80_06245 [Kribbellaceae bacterium]|nr:hypothetical protein [Kribbellaceae bacterium]